MSCGLSHNFAAFITWRWQYDTACSDCDLDSGGTDLEILELKVEVFAEEGEMEQVEDGLLHDGVSTVTTRFSPAAQ